MPGTERRLRPRRPPRLTSIPFATIVPATEIATMAAHNEAAALDPARLRRLAQHIERAHAESHTNAGIFNSFAGIRNMGSPGDALTMAERLDALDALDLGVETDQYDHGTYVLQAHLRRAADFEEHCVLGISTSWPGQPEADRSGERLVAAVLMSNGQPTGEVRDELGMEGNVLNFWNRRTPPDAEAFLATAADGMPAASGDQWLGVRHGPTAGFMTVGTGIQIGTAKAAYPGMRLHLEAKVRALTVPRDAEVQVRWMSNDVTTPGGSTYVTLDENGDPWGNGWSVRGAAAPDSTSAWGLREMDAIAPPNTSWFALQVRWSVGVTPFPDGEVHGVDDASAFELSAVLTAPIDDTQTTIYVSPSASNRQRVAATAIDPANDWFVLSGHGLNTGTVVYVDAPDPPAPLVTGTPYYVRDVTASTFRLAASLGGAAIDLTTVGGAAVFITRSPETWPWKGPRAGDPTPTATTYSTSTAECVHWLRADDEAMAVVATPVLAEDFTLGWAVQVVRGWAGTTPAAHTENTKVRSPCYVGSIAEGADATFAGSPAVNDPTKALRYVAAIEQDRSYPARKQATTWLARWLMMHDCEYDRPGGAPGVPSSTDPDEWAGVSLAGLNRSVTGRYIDIMGTGWYNVSDTDGYDVTPWSIEGIPGILDPDTLHTNASWGIVQARKLDDFRALAYEHGLGRMPVTYNNLAAQANSQDVLKLHIVTSGYGGRANLEFWLNKPNAQAAKVAAQRDQWMTLCRLDYRVTAWAKSGQSGLVGTPFDSGGDGIITAADLYHYRRWVYGHFLMGWRGSGRQQMISEWGFWWHENAEQLFRMLIGVPVETFDTWADLPAPVAGVKARAYSRGRVYVNTTGAPVGVVLPAPLVDAVDAGLPVVGSKTIPAYDVGVFVSEV